MSHRSFKSACLATILTSLACQGTQGPGDAPGLGSSPTVESVAHCDCGPLPVSSGETRTVSSVDELIAAVDDANARSGLTVLIGDGTYEIPQMLWIEGDNITVRSASGNRDAVVLRGHGMTGDVSHIFNVAGSRFTLADMTVGWVANHAVQIHSSSDNARIHNVRFVDTGEQMLKVSFVPGQPDSAEQGEVSCSLFEYTAGVGPQYYIGGIDAHQAHDWVVRDNVFRGIRSPEADLAEHAIHFWSASRDPLIERNVILRCDRGIGLGLGDRGGIRGIVRNNFVSVSRDVGIGLESTNGARVLHNTVVAQAYPNAIELRFGTTQGGEVAGNLSIGAIALRDGATAALRDNVSDAARAWFVAPENGDLHLVGNVDQVVNQTAARPDVPADIDCQARPRDGAADIGADEW